MEYYYEKLEVWKQAVDFAIAISVVFKANGSDSITFFHYRC